MKPLYLVFILSLTALIASCASQQAELLDSVKISGEKRPLDETIFDVQHYHMKLNVYPDKRSIEGEVDIFGIINPEQSLSEDKEGQSRISIKEIESIALRLDTRFDVRDVLLNDQKVKHQHQNGRVEVTPVEAFKVAESYKVTIAYKGKPFIAENAPWEGGFVWDETKDGQPWIATAVQGRGCDLWWPCKDDFRDKANSMTMEVSVPKGLSVAMNGVLDNIIEEKRSTRFVWKLNSPASDYNIALNIAPFKRLQSTYTSVNGEQIPIEFWALPENAEKAKEYIDTQITPMLQHFENLLGPYPWQQDKVGFVETPHQGMEHQTMNAYGDEYYRGIHEFSWLLHHELAHEWFGNLITHKDVSDVFIHESFGQFMQPVYVEALHGKWYSEHYYYEDFLMIENCTPVLNKDAQHTDDAFHQDVYVKGSWFLKTLKFTIGEEAFWNAVRHLLYGQPDTHHLKGPFEPQYRTVEDFKHLAEFYYGKSLSWMFDHYLTTKTLPVLDVIPVEDGYKLQWITELDEEFPIPLPIYIDGKDETVVIPKDGLIINGKNLVIDPEVQILRRLPITRDCKKEELES